MLDAIIISDIHLGSKACQANKLSKFLDQINANVTRRLIINGDFFDSWDFRRLKKNHWNVLGDIRKFSDNIEVIWNVGNHDGPAEIVSHLLGIHVKNEYELVSGDQIILAIHGDLFDTFLSEHPFITRAADIGYNFLQKIDPSLYAARAAKRSSKTFMRNAKLIKERSKAYAQRKGCNKVCVGHTHHEEEDGNYYNSGCWTDAVCSYLTIENGTIKLNHFES